MPTNHLQVTQGALFTEIECAGTNHLHKIIACLTCLTLASGNIVFNERYHLIALLLLSNNTTWLTAPFLQITLIT